jgi:hypothetical protein
MSVFQRPELNWQKCAELHNRLLEIGWVPVHNETGWDQDKTPWWEEHFGQDKSSIAVELERRLEPSVVQFLQATVNDYPGNEKDENLFYYISKLISPEDMIKSLNQDETTRVPNNSHTFAMLPTPGVPVTGHPPSETPAITEDRFVWLYRVSGWGHSERYGGI